MRHVIVDSKFSLVREQFVAKKVIVVNDGKKTGIHLSLLEKPIRKEVCRLLKAHTKEFTKKVDHALNTGNGNMEFELRKRFCVSIEN